MKDLLPFVPDPVYSAVGQIIIMFVVVLILAAIVISMPYLTVYIFKRLNKFLFLEYYIFRKRFDTDDLRDYYRIIYHSKRYVKHKQYLIKYRLKNIRALKNV